MISKLDLCLLAGLTLTFTATNPALADDPLCGCKPPLGDGWSLSSNTCNYVAANTCPSSPVGPTRCSSLCVSDTEPDKFYIALCACQPDDQTDRCKCDPVLPRTGYSCDTPTGNCSDWVVKEFGTCDGKCFWTRVNEETQQIESNWTFCSLADLN